MMTWAPCPNALLPFRSSLRQACVRQEVQLQSTQPLATRTRKYESYSQLGKKQSQITVESSGTRWCKRWVGCNANAKGQFRNKQGTNPSMTLHHTLYLPGLFTKQIINQGKRRSCCSPLRSRTMDSCNWPHCPILYPSSKHGCKSF